MALNPNQFKQTPEVGYVDLQTGQNNVHNAMVVTGTVNPLVPAQTVKLVDSFTAIPSVEAAAIGDVAWGVVVRNLKDADFPAEARLEIARVGTVVFMQASAAIARGADVQYNPTTGKIATKASTNGIVGQAYDKAAGDNDIIRVLINPRSGA